MHINSSFQTLNLSLFFCGGFSYFQRVKRIRRRKFLCKFHQAEQYLASLNELPSCWKGIDLVYGSSIMLKNCFNSKRKAVVSSQCHKISSDGKKEFEKMRWMFLYIYIVGAYVLYADRISIIYYYYRKRASDLMFKYYDLHFIWIVCES